MSLLLASTLLVAAANHLPVVAQGNPAPGRTVWEGVYTDAQADRANAVFTHSCAGCHTLASQGESPLSGASFWESYTQRTVADLLNYVRTNMPNGSGGSLPADEYNDLVALILKSNGLPAGKTELAPETIAGVQILPKDGGTGELPANTLVRVVGCLARQGSEWILTSATTPERVDKIGEASGDASRPLGNRTMALKFVLTRLDSFVGQRMAVSGMLMGAGGVDGINVTSVSRVSETCP
ncbi:MAG TPA: cytochrome c [Vicinamibacterales bacterium]|nr:cytochrome c [Vicinamibacterales bacterium]